MSSADFFTQHAKHKLEADDDKVNVRSLCLFVK